MIVGTMNYVFMYNELIIPGNLDFALFVFTNFTGISQKVFKHQVQVIESYKHTSYYFIIFK